MKNILIAAAIVGAAAAGVILYLRRKTDESEFDAGRVVDAASDAYNAMNNGIGQAERPAQHSMG